MPTFTVTGDVDPFLHVSLRKGETIFCESDAMVMMEAPLDLTGSMQGGLVRAAMRRLANGESFFQQRIEAKRGDGDCLLAPNMPGGMQVLDVGARQYRMSDGAYVAATERIEVNARMQSLGNALFGGTGGFFIGETQGDGQVVVGGFGSLFTLDVAPGKDIVIDNGHVVAWDSTLRYEIAASTSQSQGLLRNLTNSVTSGEGVVLRFSGQGQVIVCSRNRQSFLAWLAEKLNVRS
ncbi:TIGR00266 family protein [Extensimonas sp. H3M7-6]|uniref:TIGR00266 family protein n=1 Tax=Extensimonas soli TaxID=3031322 RepID=UPI0023DA1452|nr:TIGR00266 family protein [Extensimonas sp. H3M7-6]MDF1482136.1 TIGR00266 family protein [Extensimonas sp. H3M7-6]